MKPIQYLKGANTKQCLFMKPWSRAGGKKKMETTIQNLDVLFPLRNKQIFLKKTLKIFS